MKKSIIIGRSPDGRIVEIDLELLLRSRLLLQANSGGGKSVTLRLLIEQLFGKVQVIVIDREGEFPSLCDEHDFLLVGQGHDIPADIRSARLLAEKLLELRASAIIDLYEAFRTNMIGRLHWVREFLWGLVDAPKNLWHDVVVIVDEAHLFCPQENPKAAKMSDREIIQGCKEAMIALATIGRKRGQCAVWATQRLAKLDKDASAELHNRMVGLTFEGQDVDRAVDLMSVSREDRGEFRKSLRELEPGNFYVFGRAITKERTLFKVTKPKTHVEGQAKGVYEPPPPSEKVKALLAKLGDLPKEVDAKAKTEKELRAEIRRLEGELVKAKTAAARPVPPPARPLPPTKPVIETKTEFVNVEVPVIKPSELKWLESIIGRAEGMMAKAAEAGKPFETAARDLRGAIADIVASTTRRLQVMKAQAPPRAVVPAKQVPNPIQPIVRTAKAAPPAPASDQEEFKPSRSHLAILQAILEFESIGIEAPSRNQVVGWLGIKVTGTFRTNLSDLRTAGCIDYRGKGVIITETGRAIAPAPEVEPTTQGILDRALRAYSGTEGAMLKTLHRIHPEWMSREDLADSIGNKIQGTFRTNLSTLHVAEVIDYGEDENKNKVKCADWMFVGQAASV